MDKQQAGRLLVFLNARKIRDTGSCLLSCFDNEENIIYKVISTGNLQKQHLQNHLAY